jgi:hypothetical protein
VEQQRRVGWSGTRRSSVKVLKGMVRRRHPGDERERERERERESSFRSDGGRTKWLKPFDWGAGVYIVVGLVRVRLG